jgi:hypothetical protein
MESLHPNVRLVWGALGLGAAVAVGVLVAVLDDLFLSVGPLLGAGAAILALPVAAWYVWRRYQTWRFEVRDDALYLERGVFTWTETDVPYVRVQHVDTKRNPLDRLLGLSRVVVYTAGSRGADVAVPGLAPERASSLRDTLRELAIDSEPTDGV